MTVLASIEISGTTPTLVYRVAGNVVASKMMIAETGAAATTISIWLVPFDTIRGDEHLIFDLVRLDASSTIILPEHEMRMGDREEIWAATAAGGAVSITIM